MKLFALLYFGISFIVQSNAEQKVLDENIKLD